MVFKKILWYSTVMRYRYKKGLVIGRFQPFHKGHTYLILKSLEFCEKIVIAIGSANRTFPKQKKTAASIHPRYANRIFLESLKTYKQDNPFNAGLRKKMIEEFIGKEDVKQRVSKVIFLYDHPDDDVWLANALKKAGSIDVVIGNNAWVNTIFENAGYKIKRVRHYKREMYEGKKIRKLMKRHEQWEDLVPEYLVDNIKKEQPILQI